MRVIQSVLKAVFVVLGAVTDRVRQRQARRMLLNYMTIIGRSAGMRNENGGDNGIGIWGRNVGGASVVEERSGGGERGRNSEGDISQLLKTLKMELDVESTDNGGDGNGDVDNWNFFDCNICLDMARDPILTCCGHLFCWGCFYQVQYFDSSAKECPVCKGEVTDSSITPIYGNGKNSLVLESETGVKIPPRPRASRVESVRQQRISHIPVTEALRRIRVVIGSIRENPFLQRLNSVGPNSETHPSASRNLEAGGSRRRRSRQLSRVPSENAASLSSISTALNNAERLVEDLETYINHHLLGRTEAEVLPADHDATSDTRSEPQTVEMNPTVPVLSSSERTVANTVVDLDNLSANGAVEIDPTISRPSSSSRRRSGVSRALNVEGGTSRAVRRRQWR